MLYLRYVVYFHIDQDVICIYVLADCVGTTNSLIMGPMFVGSVSAKLSTLNCLSFAMIRKFSFRLRRAGESENTSKEQSEDSNNLEPQLILVHSPLQSSLTSIEGKRRYLTLTEYSAMEVPR